MMPGMSGYEVCRRLRADPGARRCCRSCSSRRSIRRRSASRASRRAPTISSASRSTRPSCFARVRSLLRIKSLHDEVRRQAAALAELNAKLEQRVSTRRSRSSSACRRLKRFFSPRLCRRDPRRPATSDPRAASPRDLLRVPRPARLHRLHRDAPSPRRCRRCCASTTRRWAR